MIETFFIKDGLLRWSDNPQDNISLPRFVKIMNIIPGLAIGLEECNWIYKIQADPNDISETITLTKLCELY